MEEVNRTKKEKEHLNIFTVRVRYSQPKEEKHEFYRRKDSRRGKEKGLFELVQFQ